MRRIDQRAVPLAREAALARDRRIDGRRLAVAAIARIGQAVPRFTVVGIDDMAARAARLAIVTGLVVGAHEPHIGIVEARLVEVEDCDPDAQPGAGPAVRLLAVGAPRL